MTLNSRRSGSPSIDWHCHLLPGLDDGPASPEEAIAMARLLAAAGFAEVYCTPHCMRGAYENSPDKVRRAVDGLRESLHEAGIPLALHPGMEYYLDEYFSEELNDPLPLGNSPFLLVEAPSQAPPDLIRENVFLAVRKGFTPLFAHPERYQFLPAGRGAGGFWAKAKKLLAPGFEEAEAAADPFFPDALIPDLQRMGCRFQGNIGSFVGDYGKSVRKRAHFYLQKGLYSHFGSDGHRAHLLAEILERGMKRLGETGWLPTLGHDR